MRSFKYNIACKKANSLKVCNFIRIANFVLIVFCFTGSIWSQSSKKDIDSLLKLIKSSKQDSTYIKNLNSLAVNYLNVAKFDSAITLSKQALHKSELINYKQGSIAALINIGKVLTSTGSYDSAIYISNVAIKLVDPSRVSIEQPILYSIIGNCYLNKGDYEKALAIFFKCLRMNEIIDNKKGLAAAYNNIGIIYRKQHDFEKTLNYFLKALKLFEESGNAVYAANSYNNIGALYNENGKPDKALFYYQKSIAGNEKSGNKKMIAVTLLNIGNIYTNQKNYTNAYNNYEKVLTIAEEIGDKQLIGNSYLKMGIIFHEKGMLNDCEEYLMKALKSCTETGDKANIKNSYEMLGQLFEKKGDYKQALSYQKLYTAMNDSLFNLESNKQIADMNTKYESELKDKELLKKDAEISLQQANSQKQTIIRNGFIIGFVFLLGLIVFIYRGYIQKQKTNKLLNDKNQKITDSINYAKLIQSSILPSQEDIQKYLPNSFIYYQPKDIVSGDFYWLYPINEQTILFAVVDCTGHGVPGAMMSMLGYSLLEQIVNQNKTTTPSEILDQLNFLVIESLKQSDQVDSVKNGIDMALFKLDFLNYELEYAGAKNPLYIVRDQNLIELKADRKSIGLSNGSPTPFVNQHVKLLAGDQLYAFSDGYIDQKGGSENKKFYSSNFQKMLLRINQLNPKDQQIEIENSFVNWKGNKEQIDDVTVFGIKC